MEGVLSNPWILGIGTAVIAGAILYILFGKKKIFSSRFSSTQYIKVLPPSLGGVDHLDLDNVATLHQYVPYDMNQITLILNKAPIREFPIKGISGSDVKLEGMKMVSHKGAKTYSFSTGQNTQKIKIAGRMFVVSLKKISLLDVKNVPNAKEYEFGIFEE